MPATIFSGSDIKTLKDNLSLNDKAKILPVSGSPASGAGVAAPIGSLVLDYTNGKTYKKIGALDTDWSELGSGIGGINYVTNTDAEAGTAGWSTYADAAGAQPVDGTGGSPNVTWTRSTTTPLRGTADFNFAKDAANRQGQGVATDITINLADQAKVLTVSFDYEILSGTYATGDLTVYLIQDPAGTPVVIQPAGYQVQAATAGTKMRQIATFQTAATGQSYRICFHVASTSASAYTLAIDNVICGPQVVQYGAPVTDWTAYTPTGSWTTNTTYTGYWRRVGDSIEVRADIATSGAPNSSVLRVNLPSGITIDTAKIPGVLSQFTVVGTGGLSDSSTTAHKLYAAYYSTTSVEIRFQSAATSTNAQTTQVTQANPITFGAGDSVNIQFKVPVVGWSSTVQMSNDTDTRVVAAKAYAALPTGTIGTLFSSSTTTIFGTKEFDTHGAYDATTGLFTAPVPGIYVISGIVRVSGTEAVDDTVNVGIFVNATNLNSQFATTRVTATSITSTIVPFYFLVNAVAGDQLSVRTSSTIGAPTFQNNAGGHQIYFHRLSGPSAIAASETVACRYETTAGPVVNTTTPTITYGTRIFDTHNAMSGSTYTIPVSGVYQFQAYAYTASVAWTAASPIVIQINKSGVLFSALAIKRIDAAVTVGQGVSGTALIRCNAGDQMSIGIYTGVSTTLSTVSGDNFISIVRVGN